MLKVNISKIIVGSLKMMNQHEHYLNAMGIVRWVRRSQPTLSANKLLICLEEQACGLEKNLLDNIIQALSIDTRQIDVCIGESVLREKHISNLWRFYFGILPSDNLKHEHVFVLPSLKAIIEAPALKRQLWSILCSLK